MYTLSWALAALIAPVMSGVVIDRFGAAWLWGLCAVVGTAAGLGYGLLMRRLPAEESVREPVRESVRESVRAPLQTSLADEVVVEVGPAAVGCGPAVEAAPAPRAESAPA